MSSLPALAITVTCCAAISCRSLGAYGPPPPELCELLAAPIPRAAEPLRDTWRGQGLVELDSQWIAGEYEVVIVAETSPLERVRLQLFPALGGKILDVLATPERLAGSIPAAGLELDWSAADGAPPRHILSFFAAGLLEQGQTLTWPRVRGARREGSGWELELEPSFPGIDVWARIDGQGGLLERRYRLGGVGWTERFDPHRFESRGFHMTIRDQAAPAPADVPEAAFDLILGGNTIGGGGGAGEAR